MTGTAVDPGTRALRALKRSQSPASTTAPDAGHPNPRRLALQRVRKSEHTHVC